MRLADVKENNTVIITKILGYGAFRRRLTEMGFVRGKEVTVIKNAPLKDPVQYRVLGYNVSLRRDEARLIEVVEISESLDQESKPFGGVIDLDKLKTSVREKGNMINVALVGNPNCGKTTLFNKASGAREHVGNYGGVTVDLKKASFKFDNYSFNITDLPGTYSLTAFTPEELFARNYILGETPDIVVNVLDASNLERNLYLTTQLIDMDIKVVIALNMYDDLMTNGANLDIDKLGKLLGVPIVPTTAIKGTGIVELFNKLIDVYEDRDPVVRHIHINYGEEMEKSISAIRKVVQEGKPISAKVSSRYLALRLLDKDKESIKLLEEYPNVPQIEEVANKEIPRVEARLNEDSSHLISDFKYGFIAGALKETYSIGIQRRHDITEKIDKVMTHRIWGFPLFLLFMFTAFFATFKLGSYPMDWIDKGVLLVSGVLDGAISEGVFKDLLLNGIIDGIGSVIVFLPNILILFFFISIMEDTGYMARAAFIMDKLMHKMGLHGRSFIPLVMGFGCNVPAIMSTRTLRNRNDRLLTMLIIPLMSCSARLPVYIVFISAFFTKYPALVLMGLYFTGIVVAIIVANIFNKLLFVRKETPFVMELPHYRVPTFVNTVLHMWEKASQYLKKISGTILIAVVIIWALGYFPANNDMHTDELSRIENSYLGQIGKGMEPVMKPLGFDWRMSVSLLAGIPAKEIVISTMGVLFQTDNNGDESQMLQEKLKTTSDGSGKPLFTIVNALAFLVFVLLYFPCVAVLAAIKRESGSWKWALFTLAYTTAIAWIASFLVYQIGLMFI
jgi:ferrous iron transport protein B